MNKQQIKQLINNPSPTLFEIGCADGSDTLDFINVFNDLNFRMFCFEPDERNTGVFEDIIKDKRVSLFKGVIGKEDNDSVDFYKSHYNKQDKIQCTLSSSLRSPSPILFQKWPFFSDFLKTKVKCIKLDTFVKNNNIDMIDFIWADVQGCEDIMIEGGKETFESKVRYLYTEYSNEEIYHGEPNLQKILSLLPNYSVMQDFGSDVLLRNNKI